MPSEQPTEREPMLSDEILALHELNDEHSHAIASRAVRDFYENLITRGELIRREDIPDAQPVPAPGPKPYTVVLRYDDPWADNDRPADDHVFVVDEAASPQDAESRAIRALVISERGKLPGTQAFDEATRDFTAIAIYEGSPTNLA